MTHNAPNVWKVPGYTETMVAIAAAFGAWSILLPVVPLAVLDAGGSASLAGGTTGLFMAATVITQFLTPRMLRSFGYRPVMMAASFMLGVPAFGHLLGEEAWVTLTFSALRGIGFGALTVAQSALVAELAPVGLRGKATGMIGVFVGLAQTLFLPLGLAMSDWWGYSSVYIAAAAIGLLAVAMCIRLPRIKAQRVQPGVTALPQVPTWKLVAVPALALTTVSISYGAISAFLSPAVREIDPRTGATLGGILLSLVGAASLVCRYLAGVFADRVGMAGRLYIPAQIAAFAAVALIALVLHQQWSVWWIVLGVVIFGGAFGIAQNEALLSMFERLPRERVSEASAIWNVFFDSGTGIGSTVLGAMVVAVTYSGAFGVGAVILLLGVAMSCADFMLGRSRVSEVDDIKTRLRRMRKV